jgi:hypothetical protein
MLLPEGDANPTWVVQVCIIEIDADGAVATLRTAVLNSSQA